jgi:hypothetical protein
MIRWNTNTDSYGVFAGLIDQAPIETRQRSSQTFSQARVRAIVKAERQREAQALWRVRGALAAIVLIVLVLLVGLIDAPGDHVGPDELAHARAGRQVVEVTE